MLENIENNTHTYKKLSIFAVKYVLHVIYLNYAKYPTIKNGRHE